MLFLLPSRSDVGACCVVVDLKELLLSAEPCCLEECLPMPWILLCWAVLGEGGHKPDVVKTGPSAGCLMLGRMEWC